MADSRKYYKWTKSDLEKAILLLKNESIGLNECSRRFNIAKATLKRHLMKRNKYANETVLQKGRPPVLNKDIEDMLVKHLLSLNGDTASLTMTDIRRSAYEIAEKNNIKHNFSTSNKMAGKLWFYQFIKRHPQLSTQLMKPKTSTHVDQQESNGNHFMAVDVDEESNEFNEGETNDCAESGSIKIEFKVEEEEEEEINFEVYDNIKDEFKSEESEEEIHFEAYDTIKNEIKSEESEEEIEKGGDFG